MVSVWQRPTGSANVYDFVRTSKPDTTYLDTCLALCYGVSRVGRRPVEGFACPAAPENLDQPPYQPAALANCHSPLALGSATLYGGPKIMPTDEAGKWRVFNLMPCRIGRVLVAIFQGRRVRVRSEPRLEAEIEKMWSDRSWNILWHQ